MTTHTVVSPCNGIFLINKKEQITDIGDNMEESHWCYAEWRKPDTRVHAVWFCLHEVLEQAKLEIRLVFACRGYKDGGEGD